MLRSTIPAARCQALACALFALIISTSVCSAEFDGARFHSTKAHIVLGIDLREGSKTGIGVVVHDHIVHPPQSTEVVLPFMTRSAEGNAKMLSTWGAYGGNTYLNFVMPGTGNAFYAIGLDPIINDSKASLAVPGTNISLITEGQISTLFYMYPPDTTQYGPEEDVLIRSAAQVDAIGVILPAMASRMEVRNGKTSDPPELYFEGDVGYYPATKQGSSDHLEIRYLVPATEAQKTLVEIVSKLFGAIIVPLVTIILTKFSGPRSIFRKRWVVIAGTILQVVVLIAFIVLSWRWAGATSTSNIIDMIIGGLGGLLAIVVWWIADDTAKLQKPLPPQDKPVHASPEASPASSNQPDNGPSV